MESVRVFRVTIAELVYLYKYEHTPYTQDIYSCTYISMCIYVCVYNAVTQNTSQRTIPFSRQVCSRLGLREVCRLHTHKDVQFIQR